MNECLSCRQYCNQSLCNCDYATNAIDAVLLVSYEWTMNGEQIKSDHYTGGERVRLLHGCDE
jgi:hypothetical protein